MNNFEKIKKMTLDEMAEILVSCINPYEDYADYEYFSAVLPDVYFDKNLCIKKTKQWLQENTKNLQTNGLYRLRYETDCRFV